MTIGQVLEDRLTFPPQVENLQEESKLFAWFPLCHDEMRHALGLILLRQNPANRPGSDDPRFVPELWP